MKISFHGAARTVTGSKHLISLFDGTNILLDCGMFQGLGRRTAQLNSEFGFDPMSVSIVFLSHAHIDHSGLLPKLVKDGFTGKIYCTAATRELAEILLLDSAGIQQHDADDNGHPPLYTTDDVQRTLKCFETIEYGNWVTVAPNIEVQFTHSGHLIGSAAIHLRLIENRKETTITFAGDVGRGRPALLKSFDPCPQSEYIILESTYGDSHHDIASNNVDTLLKWIKETCLQKQGKLIIPAFSVGRTQELLFLLNQLELEKRLPELNYFIDSPLSIKATMQMKKYTGEFNERLQSILEIDDDPFAFKGLKYVEETEDSIRLTEYKEPCVIISASGTADAGRVRRHIQQCVSDASNAILFAGYCGPESFGGELIAGCKSVELFRNSYPVAASVGQLKGLSAHGDCDDLCQFISSQNPEGVRGVFLVHGEYKVQQSLAQRLERKGFYPVYIPQMHEEFILNRSHQLTA